MKDKLGEKLMKEIAVLRAKAQSYLADNIHEDKKAQKKCFKKIILNLKIIKIV